MLVLGGVIVWKSTVKAPDVVQPTVKPTPVDSASPQPSDDPGDDSSGDEQPDVSEPPAERKRLDSVHTFLLVGREQSYGNTDTLMVGIYDEENKTVNVVSIPRDTCANVECNPELSETKKINSVFARADMDGLKDAISDIVGFPIDCYVSVGINGFIQLVETIGGVTFNVPHYMNYDDPTQNLHIHFSAGEQYLNGYDAIKVVRWRQNNDGTNYGDIDRINTQQNFLKTVIKQCLSWSNLKNNLSNYVDIFHEYVKTDLSTGNMVWYAQEMLKLDMDDIHFYTLPADYSVNIRGFSYGLVHVDEWVEMLQEHFEVYDQPITLDDLDLIARDENGDLYATSGEIRGGMDSFLRASDYLKRLEEWNAYLASLNQPEESGESTEASAPAEESPEEAGDSTVSDGGERAEVPAETPQEPDEPVSEPVAEPVGEPVSAPVSEPEPEAENE